MEVTRETLIWFEPKFNKKSSASRENVKMVRGWAEG